jgi:hypothetical protein
MRTAALSIVKRLAVFYDPLASGANVVRTGFEPMTFATFKDVITASTLRNT